MGRCNSLLSSRNGRGPPHCMRSSYRPVGISIVSMSPFIMAATCPSIKTIWGSWGSKKCLLCCMVTTKGVGTYFLINFVVNVPFCVLMRRIYTPAGSRSKSTLSYLSALPSGITRNISLSGKGLFSPEMVIYGLEVVGLGLTIIVVVAGSTVVVLSVVVSWAWVTLMRMLDSAFIQCLVADAATL